MNQTTVIVLVVVVALIILFGVWMWSRNRRSAELRDRFGPEYGRAVEEYGDRSRAESELEARRQRVEHLQIRPLSTEEYNQFAREWTAVQARFVDDPAGAIQEADGLVQDLMRTRGYPMGEFEQRAADISVDHPHVVEHYRAAHNALPGFGKREMNTEELRQAMVHYRALFDELLEQPSARSAA
jgi:FtsZ-interacting cell division protein ZipA